MMPILRAFIDIKLGYVYQRMVFHEVITPFCDRHNRYWSIAVIGHLPDNKASG